MKFRNLQHFKDVIHEALSSEDLASDYDADEYQDWYADKRYEIVLAYIEDVLYQTPLDATSIRVIWDWIIRHDEDMIENISELGLEKDDPNVWLMYDSTGQMLVDAVIHHTHIHAPNCIQAIRQTSYCAEVEKIFIEKYTTVDDARSWIEEPISQEETQWTQDALTIKAYMEKTGYSWDVIKPYVSKSVQAELFEPSYYHLMDAQEPWTLTRLALRGIKNIEKKNQIPDPAAFPEKVQDLHKYDKNDIALARHILQQYYGHVPWKISKKIQQSLPSAPVYPEVWGYVLMHMWSAALNTIMQQPEYTATPPLDSIDFDGL